MGAVRTASISTRAILALALAMLLGLRLLSPPGFMPAFSHGAVTITTCPDSEPQSSAAGHDHHNGHSKALHQPCAYASAASLGTWNGDAPQPATVLVAALAPLTVLHFAFVERQRAGERPPPRAPPIPD